VFCRTRIEVDELTDTLKSHGYGAQALHGGMEQRQRDRVMQMFRQKQAEILVATDVAARGLDIDHVSHVINYDIPTAAEVYVHRIGRTGRIGRDGVAITLVDPREQRTLRYIEAQTKQKIEITPLPTADALRVKRLEVMRSALKERLVKGDLAPTRALVASLADEFDVLDIAAAAVAMLHAGGDDPGDARAHDHDDYEDDGDEPGPMVVLHVGIGSKGGVRPGDLVGAITGEARITSRQIGRIRVNADSSLVEVPARVVDRVVTALKRTKIRGHSVEVRHDKGADRNDEHSSHRDARRPRR
jgi:ATP-dependent RNA helicase DeaD